MKITKTASGKQNVKMSKKEWTSIGKKAGWIKTAGVDYPARVFYTIQLNGQPIDILVNIRVTNIENDGIGDYEFWGAKEFDAGHDSIGDYEIDSVGSDDPNVVVLTDDNKRQIIENLSRSQQFKDKIDSQISVGQIKEYYKDKNIE